MPPIILSAKNGFLLQEDEAAEGTGRVYFVMSPDGSEVLFESPSRPEAEKAFERLTN